jgi:hypothetical protein
MSKTTEGRDEIATRFKQMKQVSDMLTVEAFGESVLATYRTIVQTERNALPAIAVSGQKSDLPSLIEN